MNLPSSRRQPRAGRPASSMLPAPRARPTDSSRAGTGLQPRPSGRYRREGRQHERSNGPAGLRARPARRPSRPSGLAVGVAFAQALGKEGKLSGLLPESLQRQRRTSGNEVQPQVAPAPATATLADSTELPARVDNVTSASPLFGFSGWRARRQREAWESVTSVVSPGV